MAGTVTLELLHRPLRSDAQGLVHAGYAWTATDWEPCCEAYTVTARRNTDAPEGSVVTCIRCWYVLYTGHALS